MSRHLDASGNYETCGCNSEPMNGLYPGVRISEEMLRDMTWVPTCNDPAKAATIAGIKSVILAEGAKLGDAIYGPKVRKTNCYEIPRQNGRAKPKKNGRAKPSNTINQPSQYTQRP